MCVWCVHKCMQIMMHISIILDLDTCVYDVHTCVYDVHIWCAYSVWYTYLWSWSLILVHACMMHVSKVIDPDTCVYHAGMYDEFWSSILGPYACVMHECIMYISMILMHACIYDAANFVTDGRTDGPTDKAILGVGCAERTNTKIQIQNTQKHKYSIWCARKTEHAVYFWKEDSVNYPCIICVLLSLIHIWRCRRLLTCRSRWSPNH